MTRRRIAVVTGARADYGILYEPIRAITAHPALECQVVLTGSHLAPSQGYTASHVEADGVPVAGQVDMLLDSDSDLGTGLSIGVGVMGLTREFRRLKPHILLLLGDRFEAFAAAIAAMALRIPVAHIAGGETDWANCLDGTIRNAITKIASLHFATHELYAQRIAALGEEPWRISTVGMPSLDRLTKNLMGRADLEQALGVALPSPLLLATYLPVGLRPEETQRELTALLEALKTLPEATVLFTEANADSGGRRVNRTIHAWADGRPNAHVFPALGRNKYLSAMAAADVLVGNTSSGIVEAPSFGVPVVNIGVRQGGRIRTANVIDTPGNQDAISAAIQRALTDEAFIEKAKRAENPFGDGHASARICQILASVNLDNKLMEKRLVWMEAP